MAVLAHSRVAWAVLAGCVQVANPVADAIQAVWVSHEPVVATRATATSRQPRPAHAITRTPFAALVLQVGHATVLVQQAGLHFITDPCFSLR